MILDLAILAAGSFTLALSGALQPGPMFSAVVAGSHRRGFWFGPAVVLGHALVELPVVVLLALGLAAFLENRWVLVGIGGVGAVMLVWMGVGLVRQARRPPEVDAAAGVLRWGATATGFLTSLLSPYWYLWWVTQPALLLASAAALGWPGVAAFFVGHISADLAWYSLVSLGVSRGRRILQGRVYQGLLLTCAAILFFMAGMFVKLVAERVMDG